jgi:hypothetical protein
MLGGNLGENHFAFVEKGKKNLQVGMVGRQGIVGQAPFRSQIMEKDIPTGNHLGRQLGRPFS